jgi:hypothetical protein
MGRAGATRIVDALGADVGKHVAAIEMDEGAERPLGFAYNITGTAGTDRGC